MTFDELLDLNSSRSKKKEDKGRVSTLYTTWYTLLVPYTFRL